jgi:hypothetical protein
MKKVVQQQCWEEVFVIIQLIHMMSVVMEIVGIARKTVQNIALDLNLDLILMQILRI